VGAVSRVAALLAAVTAGVAFASAAGAATAPNFHLVKFGGDAWTNYDVTAQGTQSVDWPVDLVFWGNATRSKVYNQMRWIWSGSTIYAQVDDGTGPVWVGTGGRKNTLCTDTHFRLYADGDGYLSSALLGNYVIGTAHLDRNECSSSPTFGYNETAEANVAARARVSGVPRRYRKTPVSCRMGLRRSLFSTTPIQPRRATTTSPTTAIRR
jgi:hypothetical protein